VTSEDNNRVARRGPSRAPVAAAETRAPSPAVSPLPPGQCDAVPPPWLAEKGSSKDSSAPSPQRPVEASRAATQMASNTPAIAKQDGAEGLTQRLSRAVVSGAAPSGPARSASVDPGVQRDLGAPRSVADLTTSVLLRPPVRVPTRGWRRAVHVLSGGSVNPGESPAEGAHRELVARVNVPIRGAYKIALLSLKGGVGKTTVTACVGATLASLRGDRVVAVDANPDRGTLGQRVATETSATVRDLLADTSIDRYSDVRWYTSQAVSRLEVVASDTDPAVSEAFSEADYRQAMTVLERFYNIVLTDCGTGLLHSAMTGVLDEADSLVLVSSPAIDGARSAAATLDWLDAHGYRELTQRTVVVINAVPARTRHLNMTALLEHFTARCRAVQVLPYDQHLEEGAAIDLDRLALSTRRAFEQLAATVAEDFPEAAGRHAQQGRR